MESRELKNIITEKKKKNWNEGRVQYKNREMIEEEARALEYWSTETSHSGQQKKINKNIKGKEPQWSQGNIKRSIFMTLEYEKFRKKWLVQENIWENTDNCPNLMRYKYDHPRSLMNPKHINQIKLPSDT